MAIVFRERLNIPALPLDSSAAAILARHFDGKIRELGGIDALVSRAADGIQNRIAEKPTALSRLNGLFAKVHTREELEGLVRNTLAQLQLGK